MSNADSNDKSYSLSELEQKLRDAMEAVEILKKGGNINLGEESVTNQYEQLKKEFEKKSEDYEKLDKQFQQLTQEVLELRQEKMMFEKFTELTESEKEEMKQAKDKMQKDYEIERQSALETEQEKMFVEGELEVETKEKEKAKTKYYKAIIFSAIAIAVIAGGYSILFAELAGQQYRVEVEPQTSGYTIQNLRGDSIDTYLSWRLVEGDTITVNVLNADRYDPEVFEVIKKTIVSEKELEIDNSFLHKGPKGTTSIMYEGWQGALKVAAMTETEFYVPVKFDVISTKTGAGDITIELTNQMNADGFAGWTNSIADASQNQILKSRVTIFSVNSLSMAALETIVRHELGHALGLAHSTAPEDLMYPTIETNFPYISDCDIDAMEKLYDGGNTSEVICET